MKNVWKSLKSKEFFFYQTKKVKGRINTRDGWNEKSNKIHKRKIDGWIYVSIFLSFVLSFLNSFLLYPDFTT